MDIIKEFLSAKKQNGATDEEIEKFMNPDKRENKAWTRELAMMLREHAIKDFELSPEKKEEKGFLLGSCQ